MFWIDIGVIKAKWINGSLEGKLYEKLDTTDYEATDWQIYEEEYTRLGTLHGGEDNWKLADVSKKNPRGEYLEIDIKTFLRKVKAKIRAGRNPEKAIDETAGDL